ncbi:phiSA1p31-related protein [Streptomyces sp. NBC_01212]|uniref:phiSA1p31-related protein n=1 Tax=Streptomyces sp. NBC_01212 TaxID=2903775 RepID=UPI002E0F7EFA|nr:phiSA1p31-related protein [Streptomyces sp. NBC_01212]
MAEAQYETRTRTVEEMVVILTITADEADWLRTALDTFPGPTSSSIRDALMDITSPAPETSADTFEYDGVTYDLTKTYTDRDDDDWNFSTDLRGSDGAPLARFRHRTDYEGGGYTLAYVVAQFGPLTKVYA